MGKHVDQPASPNYAAAAQAQGTANSDAAKQSLAYSNPNVFTPYGNQWTNFTYNPLTGQEDYPQVFQSLTPTGQQSLDQQQQAELGLNTLANQQTGAVGNLLNTPFSFNGQPQTSLPTPGPIQGQIDTSGVAKMPVNAGTTGQQAIMSRLEPALARARTSETTNLVNQGLRPGGEAYTNAMTDLGQQENDQRTQAVLQGLNLDMGANQQGFGQAQAQNQTANAAQQQQYNQALGAGQFGNTAQQQDLSQQMAIRNLPLNEITALMSGGQVQNPSFPGYQGTSVAPAPVFQGTQAQGAWDQNLYNQQVAQKNALTQGLFSLGGAATHLLPTKWFS